MTRERKRCPGQRSRWRRRLSWPRAPGEEEREREGLSPPYRSPTPPKSNVYEALSVFSHSSTCNPKGRGPCLHRAPGRERVPRQFPSVYFCGWSETRGLDARRKAAFAGLGSKVHHRAVQFLRRPHDLCWLRIPCRQLSARRLRSLRVTKEAQAEPGPSTACTKQSAQSHSQSVFARGLNGGGGDDVPAVLGE